MIPPTEQLKAMLLELRAALRSQNIDGCNVWDFWLDDDGSLHRRADALLESSTPPIPEYQCTACGAIFSLGSAKAAEPCSGHPCHPIHRVREHVLEIAETCPPHERYALELVAASLAALSSRVAPEPAQEEKGHLTWCPEHGLDVKIDEDGCCIGCGRDAYPLQHAIEEGIADAEAAQLTDALAAMTAERDALTARAERAEQERDEQKLFWVLQSGNEREKALNQQAGEYRERAEAAEAALTTALSERDKWKYSCECANEDKEHWAKKSDEYEQESSKLLGRLTDALRERDNARKQHEEVFTAWNRENELRRDGEEALTEAHAEIARLTEEARRTQLDSDLMARELVKADAALRAAEAAGFTVPDPQRTP